MRALLQKKAETVHFDLLTPSELAKWSAGRLKPYGKKISSATLNTLTYMAGQDLTRLSVELDKLVDYVGEGRVEITAEDVRAVVPASLEYRVFELMDCLLAGDMLKAQQIVNNLLQGGQSSVGILATLTRQVRRLTHMKCALDAGLPAQAVQSQLKLNPGAIRPMTRQCSKLSAGWLTGLYERCVEADFAVKSGRLRDADALNAVMLQIGLAGQRNP